MQVHRTGYTNNNKIYNYNNTSTTTRKGKVQFYSQEVVWHVKHPTLDLFNHIAVLTDEGRHGYLPDVCQLILGEAEVWVGCLIPGRRMCVDE